MKMNQTRVSSAVCLALTLTSLSGYGYEEFFSTPSSRAMAMGGAFVGLADDGSAAWYNPAGLARINGSDLTVEYGSKYIATETLYAYTNGDPVLDANGEEQMATSRGIEDSFKYLSWGSGDGDTGMAISYFSPYKFYSPVPETDSFSNADIEEPQFYQTSFNQFSWAGAFALGERLSVGFSADILTYAIEQLNPIDSKEKDVETDNATFGATFGALYKTDLMEFSEGSGPAVLRIGTTYRITGEADELSDFKTPLRPDSFAYGASLQIPVKAVSIIATTQMETLTYVDTTVLEYGNFSDDPELSGLNPWNRWSRYTDTDVEWQRISAGIELSFSTLLGETPAQISLRGGFNSAVNNSSGNLTLDASYRYQIDDYNFANGLYGITEGQTLYMAEQVDNVSFGAGLYIGNLFFEAAFEHRTIKNEDIASWRDNILGIYGTEFDAATDAVFKTNNEQDLVSFSLSYTF